MHSVLVKHYHSRVKQKHLVTGNVCDRVPVLTIVATSSFLSFTCTLHVAWRACFVDSVPVASGHKKQSHFL